jgi:hypothetical protein
MPQLWTDEDTRRAVGKADADLLAAAFREIAESARLGVGAYLRRSQAAALAKHLGVESVAEGRAILYTIMEHNPTLSQRVAAINAGGSVCARCQGVITMSNHAIHESGECWPLPNRPVPFDQQTWDGGKASLERHRAAERMRSGGAV